MNVLLWSNDNISNLDQLFVDQLHENAHLKNRHEKEHCSTNVITELDFLVLLG